MVEEIGAENAVLRTTRVGKAFEGDAAIFWDGTHASIMVTAGKASLHTEQLRDPITGLTTIAVQSGEIGPLVARVPLPDAQAAMHYQRSLLGTNTGPYNIMRNSCVTHCGDVLRYGGVEGVPATSRALEKFLEPYKVD